MAQGTKLVAGSTGDTVPTDGISIGGETEASGSVVIVEGDPANAGLVFIGDKDLQTLSLAAGEKLQLDVTSPNAIFARSAVGTETVNWVLIS